VEGNITIWVCAVRPGIATPLSLAKQQRGGRGGRKRVFTRTDSLLQNSLERKTEEKKEGAKLDKPNAKRPSKCINQLSSQKLSG